MWNPTDFSFEYNDITTTPKDVIEGDYTVITNTDFKLLGKEKMLEIMDEDYLNKSSTLMKNIQKDVKFIRVHFQYGKWDCTEISHDEKENSVELEENITTLNESFKWCFEEGILWDDRSINLFANKISTFSGFIYEKYLKPGKRTVITFYPSHENPFVYSIAKKKRIEYRVDMTGNMS